MMQMLLILGPRRCFGLMFSAPVAMPGRCLLTSVYRVIESHWLGTDLGPGRAVQSITFNFL